MNRKRHIKLCTAKNILVSIILILTILFFSALSSFCQKRKSKDAKQNNPSSVMNDDNPHAVLVKKDKLECQRPVDIFIDNTRTDKIPFKDWIDLFKKKAIYSDISTKTVAEAFKNIQHIQEVIDMDISQKEYSVTFTAYLHNLISERRINYGKDMLTKHQKLLSSIKKKYGVPPQILIALWGMESDFGENIGNFSAINALATLAYEGRRNVFFQNELFCALSVLNEGHIHVSEMKSSWAGAMGQPQFMPSTFFHYAADGDGDGKKDIWRNTADALTSTANYLKELKWKQNQPWGFEVKLPKKFDPYQARLEVKKSLQEWNKLGIKKADGQKISDSDMTSSIIIPSGINGPAFLVFDNFMVIREWNKSMNYALTVGHLSDRIMGGGDLVGKAPAGEKPLARDQIIELQKNLQYLGFYNDKIDGMIGLESGNAIREYQKQKGLPADAYPSFDIILQIKKDAVYRSAN